MTRSRIVAVLGMHRSGTSALTALLGRLGLPLGTDLIPGRADNEAGFWEHAGVVAAQEEILARIDRVWPGAKVSLPYPEGWPRLPALVPARTRLRELAAKELARGGGLWGFKDPRTCRLLPLWLDLAAELGVELVPVMGLRHPAAVAASLERRDGLTPAQAHLLWLQHTLEPLAHLDAMPLRVDYEELVAAPLAEARRLAEALGLPGDPAAAAETVRADLRHQQPGATLPPLVAEVWSAIRAAPAGSPLPALHERLREGEALFSGWVEQLDRLTDPDHARRPLDYARFRDDERARWRRRVDPGAPVAQDFPPLPRLSPAGGGPLDVCIVTADFQGPVRNGGIGTAYTALASALARDGHRVTVLYAAAPLCETGTLDGWAAHWRGQGIDFVPLPPAPPLLTVCAEEAVSAAVHHWLAGRRFDMVHGHEWKGVLFHALLARRQGIAHLETTFVVGVHSPVLWHAVAEGNPLSLRDLACDSMERRCVALADVVVSPSAYMLRWIQEQGWELPPSVFVQPNLVPDGALHGRASGAGIPVERIVFFGRLERRKGLDLFLEAVRRLPQRPEVVVLGKHAVSGGRRSQDALAGLGVRVIDDLDSTAALAWLADSGALAVVPSLSENSPYTVLECLAAGVPLLASDVGGIGELIHPDDRDRVLFRPTAPALAEALRRLLVSGAKPARPAFDLLKNEAAWLNWHRGRPLAPPRRPPVVDTCGAPPCAVAVPGNAPPDWRAALEQRLPGGTPVVAFDHARETSASWVLVLRPPALPVRDGVRNLLAASAWSGADAVAPFLGTPAGAVANLAGSAAIPAVARPPVLLVRREAIPEACAADDLHAVLVMEGRTVLPVPVVLAETDAPPAPGPLAPGILAAVPAEVRPLVLRGAGPAPVVVTSTPSGGPVLVLEAGVAAKPPAPGDTSPPAALAVLPADSPALLLWMRVQCSDPADRLRFALTRPGELPLVAVERPVGKPAGVWLAMEGRLMLEGGWPRGRCWAEWTITSVKEGWSASLSRWIMIGE